MVPKTQITPNISSIESPITFPVRNKNELQPLVNVLCDLIDSLIKNENLLPVPLNEYEYQQLASRLDDLLDLVDGEENHPLAPLMHFVGTLIMNYENEHFPKLAEL